MSQGQVSVLVVEDDPSIRTQLVRWLERDLDAEVRQAENGREALETLNQAPVELVISDIRMPELDGIEMLRQLRADPRNQSLEILMVSHVADESSIRDVIHLGASDYLLKPLDHDQALDRIAKAAQRIRERAAAEGTAETGGEVTRLLIADTADDFCDFARRSLSSGFAVRVARSVAEMLVQVVRWQPQAVLLSPNLPGLDLNALLDRVKGLRPEQWPKFVRLDASDSTADREGARAEGYSGAIAKSRNTKQLAEDVSRAVRGSSEAAEPEPEPEPVAEAPAKS